MVTGLESFRYLLGSQGSQGSVYEAAQLLGALIGPGVGLHLLLQWAPLSKILGLIVNANRLVVPLPTAWSDNPTPPNLP